MQRRVYPKLVPPTNEIPHPWVSQRFPCAPASSHPMSALATIKHERAIAEPIWIFLRVWRGWLDGCIVLVCVRLCLQCLGWSDGPPLRNFTPRSPGPTRGSCRARKAIAPTYLWRVQLHNVYSTGYRDTARALWSRVSLGAFDLRPTHGNGKRINLRLAPPTPKPSATLTSPTPTTLLLLYAQKTSRRILIQGSSKQPSSNASKAALPFERMRPMAHTTP